MSLKVKSVHFADSLNLRKVKGNVGVINPVSETISELFYKTDTDKYLSFYSYGAASFINYSETEIDNILEKIKVDAENVRAKEFDILEVEFSDESTLDKMQISQDRIILPIELKDAKNLLRIVMFDLSQSVSMDYYSKIAEKTLDEVKRFSQELGAKGKISMSKKSMMKFIGTSLSAKNNIVDDLYIFDSPDIAWDDDRLDKVHQFLANSFDLKLRFKELSYTFEVVDDNLQIFKELYDHRESKALEIVVIILILIEILQAFKK